MIKWIEHISTERIRERRFLILYIGITLIKETFLQQFRQIGLLHNSLTPMSLFTWITVIIASSSAEQSVWINLFFCCIMCMVACLYMVSMISIPRANSGVIKWFYDSLCFCKIACFVKVLKHWNIWNLH